MTQKRHPHSSQTPAGRARSVSHLLELIERLEDKGAHFCSRRDPIDTSTPKGMFILQMLGAVAHPEAMRERTCAAAGNGPRPRSKTSSTKRRSSVWRQRPRTPTNERLAIPFRQA
jgi:DNA invertase Pin-like site-specific DNA recombinase